MPRLLLQRELPDCWIEDSEEGDTIVVKNSIMKFTTTTSFPFTLYIFGQEPKELKTPEEFINILKAFQ